MDRYHKYVRQWLRKERYYQIKKFGIEEDDAHTVGFKNKDDEWWSNQIEMYLHRAYTLGLENANGRQALAKAVATSVGFLESAVRVYGELPEPGVPSGENLDTRMVAR